MYITQPRSPTFLVMHDAVTHVFEDCMQYMYTGTFILFTDSSSSSRPWDIACFADRWRRHRKIGLWAWMPCVAADATSAEKDGHRPRSGSRCAPWRRQHLVSCYLGPVLLALVACGRPCSCRSMNSTSPAGGIS